MKRILIFLSCFVSLVNSNIINVPTDIATIQAGINLAENGDTVLVAPGEYFENINFDGKSIFLTSQYFLDKDTSFISSTIINGSKASNSNKASVVTFASGEDTNSVLNGFTITGGKGSLFPDWPAYAGGGVFISSGGKVTNNYIRNNSVHHNTDEVDGGGVFINTGYSDTGENGMAVIKNNNITDNTVSGKSWITGGGLMVSGLGITKIFGNLIRRNKVMADNPIDIISGGGGIMISDQNPEIYNNVIADNMAPFGAGVAAYGYETGVNFRFNNNTVAHNTASIEGGGMHITNGHCTTVNNIFWDNAAPHKSGIFYRGTLNITYSVTQENLPGLGNMQIDPLFDNDLFHLKNASPAIDAGNPDAMFNDRPDPDNASAPLFPARGTLKADIGAYGGNSSVEIKKEEYLTEQNFLFKKFGNMHYRFSYPLKYDSTKIYPISILLHGWGQFGTDNVLQLFNGLQWRINAEHNGYNEFTLIPQAPTQGWSNINLLKVYNLLRDVIDNFPIDTTKIVVSGWSNGGGGTVSFINLYPELFAAAVPIATTSSEFGYIKYVPVWLFHGSADDQVTPKYSKDLVNRFEKTGLKSIYAEKTTDQKIHEAIDSGVRVFYSEFEGAGHFINRHTYENKFLFEWLKKQRRPLIRPKKSMVDKKFYELGIDSIVFRTEFSNPHNFEQKHRLIIENFNKEKLGESPLFDDGLHGDSLALDGIWGNILAPVETKDHYRLGIHVSNLTMKDEFYFNDLATFTTTGPLKFSGYRLADIANNSLPMKISLQNNGSVAVTSVSAQLSFSDTNIIEIRSNGQQFGTILPGEILECIGVYFVSLNPNSSGDLELPLSLNLSIASEGYAFWQDSANILVGIDEQSLGIPLTNNLSQNYPNPFNPKTVISWQLAKASEVDLGVYNLLGQKIATLVSKKLNAGQHQVEWNATGFASGVYLYRLETDNGFVQTRKLILLK